MVQYGVDKGDIFQTNDLFERKDLGAVTNTIFALDRAVIFASVKYSLKVLRKFYARQKKVISESILMFENNR